MRTHVIRAARNLAVVLAYLLAPGGAGIAAGEPQTGSASSSSGSAAPGGLMARAGGSHHTFQMLQAGDPIRVEFSEAVSGTDGLRGVQLPEPPLVSGPYINFEAPLSQALATTSDGSRLLAVNPANNTLVVLGTTTTMPILDEIPVGLSPCAVAIQPGTGDNLAWVVNYISDDVTVVDLELGRVVEVIPVGNEPVSIVFNADGSFAFVVIQGSPIPAEGDPIVQDGQLLAINAATHQIVSKVWLDLNEPRAAVYNPALNHVIVAALLSGNNTTVVGHPVPIRTAPPNDPPTSPCDPNCTNDCAFIPHLAVVQAFSQTAPIFAHPLLSPWPDPHADPTFPPSPLVQRIVHDAGHPADANHPWQQIVDVLSDGAGNPDPAMVAQMNAEFGIINADEVIAAIINDAKDTVDNDLAVVDVSDPAGAGLSIVNRVGNVGTNLTGMAINNIGELFVTNTEARNLTRLEPNVRGHLVDHRVTIVINPHLPGGLVHPQDLNAGIPNFNDVTAPNPLAQQLALSEPKAIAFSADGAFAYGVASGSGRLFVLDGLTAQVQGRANVGVLPTALAASPVPGTVFVMDRLDYSIFRVDVTNAGSPQVQRRRALFNPEPPEIPRGRPFLYSARFTNNFASACATCHVEGHFDGLAWDLGDPNGPLLPPPPGTAGNSHPIKGPMVTQSLRGLETHEPFHWRGDRENFQAFNPAFVGLLGGETQLAPEDMDAYTDFIMTVRYPSAPYRNRDNTFMDPGGFNGGLLFGVADNQSCNGCHRASHGGALPGPDGDQGFGYVGGVFFGQRQLVPQNRAGNKKFRMEKYCGFGLLHDGREESEDNGHPLQTFLQQFFCNFTPIQRLNIIAFMEAFPTEVDPVVGWQVLALPAVDQIVPADVISAINLMIARHSEPEPACDVVAKGVVGGQRRGYVLIATDPAVLFKSDVDTLHTLDDLLNSLSGGDALVFTAVPPGSGVRIGIDQDLDGMGDGLDPRPQKDDDGDVNIDGFVNGMDVQEFLEVLLGGLAQPFEKFHAADVDNDVDVDFDDVSGMISLLLLP